MKRIFCSSIHFVSGFLPKWPLLIWLVAISIAIGFCGGLNTAEVVKQYNAGFGRALGEFTLILLPSLVLAAAMSHHNAETPAGLVIGASPLAAAGMVCASTAYAALAPTAAKHRLDIAFGTHCGFKLLYPAGPLIVATGLGVSIDSLLVYGFVLLIPVWAVGALWVRFHLKGDAPSELRNMSTSFSLHSTALIFGPFLLLAALLITGLMTTFPNHVLLEFITEPKGALMLSAAVALMCIAQNNRRKCLDTAITQTGGLILIIGVASGFGGILTYVVPLNGFIPAQAGSIGIISLFLLAVVFKLVQGGSMVTFATVAPVAAPFVESMGISPVVAVFSICIGTFVAILPNDSFYWLVRRDALEHCSESHAITILAGGATLQALVGLGIVLLTAGLGLI